MPPRAAPRRVLAALLAWRLGAPRRHGARFGRPRVGRGAGALRRGRRRGGAPAGGQVIRGDAEGALLRFDGPARAVRCAAALRAAAQAAGLPLAQGVHVGEVAVLDAAGQGETVGGLAVHVAQAIAAAARPGEVLASALAAELCAGSGRAFRRATSRWPSPALDRPLPARAVVDRAAPRAGAAAAARAGRRRAAEPREREVLALVAEGLSNPAIADRSA